MAKWSGQIGYASDAKPVDGVFLAPIIEKTHKGDLIRDFKKNQGSGEVNDDVVLSNRISIVADPYAMNNFYQMRYVTYRNAKWKITDIEVLPPRLILTLGGVWNG